MSEPDLDPIPPEAAQDYYLDQRRYEVSDDTLESHEYRLKSFVRWLTSESHGDCVIQNMNDVDLRTVHSYRVFKREENFEGVKPCNGSTMQGQISTLRVFFNRIADINAVPDSLADRISLPTLDDGEMVDERFISAGRANKILDYLHQWEFATSEHVALLLLWRTSCRLGGLRAIDVRDFDSEDEGITLRHRPDTGTPLKNGSDSERDVSLKSFIVEVVETYLDSPHRSDQTDEHGRRPLITTSQGRPAPSTIRNWMYKWTQPCRIGEPCPEERDPDECKATKHRHLSKCPVSLSPHPIRSGSITAHRDSGTPRQIVSDRGDVSEEILEQHYDQASKRQRMRRRRDHIPDNL